MPGCAVTSCPNWNLKTKGTGIKYFRFPKDQDLANQWINACGRGNKINLKNACVCSIHFESHNFEVPLRQRLLNYNPKNSRNLKTDAVPVLHLSGSSQKQKNTGRLNRIVKRSQRSVMTNILKQSNCLKPQPSTSSTKPQASRDEPMMVGSVETIDDSVKSQTTIEDCNVKRFIPMLHNLTVAMELGSLCSEVTSGIPSTPQSSLQLNGYVPIKQADTQHPVCSSEAVEANSGQSNMCVTSVEVNDACECYVSLNEDRSENEHRGDVCNKCSPSIKTECNQDVSESTLLTARPGISMWSMEVKQECDLEEEFKVEIEDYMLCEYEPRLVKHEAFDEECYSQTQRSQHCMGDSNEPSKQDTAHTCNFKDQHNTDWCGQASNNDGSDIEVFTCSRCNYSFMQKNHLTRHMKIHHNSTTYKNCKPKRMRNLSVHVKKHRPLNAELYTCTECEFATKWSLCLKRHVTKRHSANTPLHRCTECDYTTKHKSDLTAHIRLQHSERARLYTCPHCDFSTKYTGALTHHLKGQHDPNVKLLECTDCDFTTKYSSNLTKHVTTQHNLDSPLHRCRVCDFTSKFKSSLSTHVRLQHSEHAQLYKCMHCDFATKYKSDLIKHWRGQHDPNIKLHECTVCDFTTKYNDSLTRHIMAKHSADAPLHWCPECDYTSKHKSALTSHIRLEHSGRAQLYKCTHCDFTTKYRGTLTHHLKGQHDRNVKIYECMVCDFTTKHCGSLTKHVTEKHGPDTSLHRCAECGLTFNRKSTLTTHIRLQHSGLAQLYECKHCGFVTKYNWTLARHLKLQHDSNVKLYKCTECYYTTKYSGNLSKHVTKQHDPVDSVH